MAYQIPGAATHVSSCKLHNAETHKNQRSEELQLREREGAQAGNFEVARAFRAAFS